MMQYFENITSPSCLSYLNDIMYGKVKAHLLRYSKMIDMNYRLRYKK